MSSEIPIHERAFASLINYLSRRDHSERELFDKLSRRYERDVVNGALTRARESGYLPDPVTLAGRIADQLHRKNKSYPYIIKYLRQRGLPEVPMDPEIECQKAAQILARKFKSTEKLSHEKRQKIWQYLRLQGFSSQTVKVLFDENQ